MTAPTVRIEDASVVFGALAALDHVDMTVRAGDIHAVIGPNGAGKSTLFNAISGVYPLASGSVTLDERPLAGLHAHEVAGRGIGRSFQNLSARGDETVMESLLVGRHHLMRHGAVSVMTGWPSARAEERRHRDRVREIARFTGIDDSLGRPLAALPYGLRKIADVTRAICMEPRLLMLDEPAAGLDTAETAEMTALIRDVREQLGLTVLVIEHDMDLVMTISDRVTVLDFGRRISDGTPAEVRADPAVADAYLGTGEGRAA